MSRGNNRECKGKKKNVFSVISYTLLILTLLSSVAYAGSLSAVRLRPSSTATRSIWHVPEITNLTAYYYYYDGRLNVPQDWMGQIRRNNVVNVSLPQSLAHWTFDYDTYKYVAERSLSAKKYNGTRYNMFSSGAILYYPFEDFSTTTAWDWSEIFKKVTYALQEKASSNYTVNYSNSFWYRAYDGNWSSYAQNPMPPGDLTLTHYINYTIPSNGRAAVWKVGLNPLGTGIVNSSFVLNSTSNCFNKTFGKLVFKIDLYRRQAGSQNEVTIYCMRSNYTWYTLYNNLPYISLRFYEDQILWLNRTNTRYNGTNTGTSAAIGKIGMGLGFTSTGQYSTIGQDISLINSFSIATWAKDVDNPGSASYIIGNHLYSGYDRAGYFTDSTLRVESMTDNDYCTAPDTRDGLWHHYVFNVNAGTCQFYKDGVAMTMTDNVLSNPYLLINRIGASGASNVWNGTIDELYLYNRTLTTTEITRLVNVSCHSGSCYDFDGVNDYINISNIVSTLSAKTMNITVGLWVKPISNQIQYSGLFGYTDSQLSIDERSGTNNYAFCLGGVCATGCYAAINKWTHIIGRYNGSYISCFTNGTERGRAVKTGALPVIGAHYIGFYGGGNRYFNGFIDDVIIYNKSLSAAQIRMLYDNSVYKTSNFLNGTWTANITTTNFSTVREVKTSTGTNRSLLYDSILQVWARDDFHSAFTLFSANMSNLNTSEKKKQYVSSGDYARFNTSYGRTVVYANKTGYEPRSQLVNIISRGHNVTITLGFNINFTLWDEVTNVSFNPANLSCARLWYNDNATYYDFKGLGRSWVQVPRDRWNSTRIELCYLTGSVINRYIDPQVVDVATLKVCANKEHVTHFESYIASTTNRLVKMRNKNIGCYVAMDYTRFGYQNAYILRVFTIDTSYFLNTLIDGIETQIANIDGGIASTIDIDTLEFTQRGYNVDIFGRALSVEHCSGYNCCTDAVCVNESIAIYYYDVTNNSDATTLDIYRLDTDELIYSQSSFANQNTFTVVYDYSALTGVNESTIFKVVVCKTVSGVETCRTEYSGILPSSGSIPPGIAVLLNCLIIIFGLTAIRAKDTFGWFGIFVMLIGLFVLGMSTMTWYIQFFAGINVIILLFMVAYLFVSKEESVA